MSLRLVNQVYAGSLRTGSSGLLRNKSTFSLALWFKWEWQPGQQPEFDLIAGGVDEASLDYWAGIKFDDADHIMGQFVGAGPVANEIVSSAVFPKNQWVHLAYTCADGAQRLYQNGTLVASGSVASPATEDVDAYIELPVKQDARRFQDFAIWDGTALSAANVAALYAATSTPTDLSATAYWTLDKRTGAFALTDTQIDDTPGSVDFGTLVDSPSGTSAQWIDDPAYEPASPPTVTEQGMIFVDYDNGNDANDGYGTIALTANDPTWANNDSILTDFGGTFGGWVFEPGHYIRINGTGWWALCSILSQFENTLTLQVVEVNGSPASESVTLTTGPKRTVQAALTAVAGGTGSKTVCLVPGVHVIDFATGLTIGCPSGTDPVVAIKKAPGMPGKIHVVDRRIRLGHRIV